MSSRAESTGLGAAPDAERRTSTVSGNFTSNLPAAPRDGGSSFGIRSSTANSLITAVNAISSGFLLTSRVPPRVIAAREVRALQSRTNSRPSPAFHCTSPFRDAASFSNGTGSPGQVNPSASTVKSAVTCCSGLPQACMVPFNAPSKPSGRETKGEMLSCVSPFTATFTSKFPSF
ncbi:MAG: hypothetical protein BWY09_01321 [Candidatus Hydrogenedentes bacterium ADurb.Bin179]|nr:MAG: hypothetical protein BWY09_01321 [Candidatus Hydrogenedentes bacterium ADurb.Bin179]